MRNDKCSWFILVAAVLLLSCRSFGQNCENIPDDCPDGDCCRPDGSGGNPFWIYNGNVHREVSDLALSDGVGADKLKFERISSSRWLGNIVSEFGTAGNWRHNYFWDISEVGANSYGPVIRVSWPSGVDSYYYKESSTSLYYVAGAAVQNRLLQSDIDPNQFYLLSTDGTRHAFYKGPGSTFQMQGVYDAFERFSSFSYDSQGRLVKVADPNTNHFIQIEYGNPTNFVSPGRISFQWADAEATSVVIAATWNGADFSLRSPIEYSPAVSSDPPGIQQNNVGDKFDLTTNSSPLITSSAGGSFGSLGNVYFNYDETNFYVGAYDCEMLGDGDAMILFLDFNTLAENASNLWNKTGAPNGLDYLHNVEFVRPMDIAMVLGDEYGDGNYPSFELGSGYNFGQGVFLLGGSGAFVPVSGATVSQFDGEGTNATVSTDDDGNRLTDRWEVKIPWSDLGASDISSITTCVVAGVVASQNVSGNNRYLSAGYLGDSAEGPLDQNNEFGFNFMRLTGTRLRMPGRDPYWQLQESSPCCTPESNAATNGSPLVTADPPGADQNNIGDNFDFNTNGGSWITSGSGGYGSFGQIYVNYDATNFYVGGIGLDVSDDHNGMIVFLDFDTLTDNASNLWQKTGQPYALDYLHNVKFAHPMDIAILLGDEWGDANSYAFQIGSGYQYGQGAFYLGGSGGFNAVAGARISQFDGTGTNPTTSTDGDGNRITERWEVSIPWTSLNAQAVSSVSTCFIAGVLASDGTSGNDRYLSGYFLGDGASGSKDTFGNFAFNFVSLTGSCVRLPGRDYSPTSNYQMYDAGGGLWTGAVDLAEGVYQYKFIVNGTNWLTDTNNPYVDEANDFSSVIWIAPEFILCASGSDGRVVSYEYDSMFIDGIGHGALRRANYGDGTSAKYSYRSPPPGKYWRPVLIGADDPMYPPPYSRMAYSYQRERDNSPEAPVGVSGMIYEERHLVTSALVARLTFPTNQPGMHVVEYGDGSKKYCYYPDENRTRVAVITNEAGEAQNYSYVGNQGFMSSYVDRLGNTHTYGLSAHFGVVTSEVDSAGRSWNWSYTDNTYPVHLQAMTDPLGRTTTNTRDGSNRITRVDYPDGTYQTFTYDALGQVQTERKRDGTFWSNTIDSLGRTIAVTDPHGNVTKYGYDERGHLVTTTNALGHVTRYTYDWRGNPISTTFPDGSTQTIRYNAYGQPTNVVSPSGGMTIVGYDVWGYPESQTDPLGYTTYYTYDYKGRLRVETTPSGQIITNAYDGLGRKIMETDVGSGAFRTWSYGPDGIRTQEDRLGRATLLDYDQFGYLTSETSPGGSTTTYSYDLVGNRLCRTNAMGEAISYTYDAANRPISIRDCRGFITSNYYDGLGRLTGMQDPNGIAEQRTYDGLGKLTGIMRDGLLVQSNWYNALGWLVAFRDASGLVISNTFDEVGRPLRTYLPDGTFVDRQYTNTYLARETDRAGRISIYQRDVLGRVTNRVDNSGHSIGYQYDAFGNVTNLVDQNGHHTYFSFDAEGRKTARVFNDLSGEQYQYDDEGQLSAKRDCIGRWTYYSYDLNGNLTNVNYHSDPDVGFEYDALNRRTKMIDSVGTTTWSYVEGCTKETGTDGPFQNDSVLYGYDASKRLTNMAYCGISVGYGFDSLDRIVSVSAPEGSYSYMYTRNGRLPAELIRPNGVRTVYHYDALLRLTNLVHKKSSGDVLLSFAYTYDGHDQRTRVVREDGRRIDYGYDAIGQLTSAEGYMGDDSAWPGYSFRYAYDPAGNMTQKVENGFVTSTRYNELNQLTTSGWAGVMAVMGSVNITDAVITVNSQPVYTFSDGTFVVTNQAVVPGPNEWIAIATDVFGRSATSRISVVASGHSYAFDANGNLTNDGEFAYAFDEADHLVRATKLATGLNVMGSQYDGLARRYKRTQGEGGACHTNLYVYSHFIPLAVLDGESSNLEVCVRGMDISGTLDSAGGIGGILGVSIDVNDPGELMNPLNSGNGSIAATYAYEQMAGLEYAPFGTLVSSQPNQTSRFLFNGKELDSASGLLYFGYRHYHPSSGRWLSRDPIGEQGGQHLYVFVENRPVVYVDPLGLTAKRNCHAVYKDFSLGLGDFHIGPPVGWISLQGDMKIATQLRGEVCEECCPGGWTEETRGSWTFSLEGSASVVGGPQFNIGVPGMDISISGYIGVKGSVEGTVAGSVEFVDGGCEGKSGGCGKIMGGVTLTATGGGELETSLAGLDKLASATANISASRGVALEACCNSGGCSVKQCGFDSKWSGSAYANICAFGACYRYTFWQN
ncbi:MAG: hypothetical protein KJ626_11565 [Verrucomicrobia bacterium]|nr:hypothetical protein [Verrucomicrobiota bacterium]